MIESKYLCLIHLWHLYRQRQTNVDPSMADRTRKTLKTILRLLPRKILTARKTFSVKELLNLDILVRLRVV